MNAGTLIIADDHPLFRAALREVIGQLLPGVEIIEAQDAQELRSATETHPLADLLLMDLHMPGAQGFSTLIMVRAQHPAIPVAVISAAEEATVVQRSLDFGASAFIPKSATMETIGVALRTVLDGGVWVPEHFGESAAASDQADREMAARVATLTPQQFRVLTLLADGRLNKQIAGELEVSEATIKAHVTAILRKLGLYRRTQVAILAQRLLQADSAPLLPLSSADTMPADDSAAG
jgi:DNA-binding NarL/FixJ family response regulator